jgi:hypothetical protein
MVRQGRRKVRAGAIRAFPGSAEEVARLVGAWRRFTELRPWDALADEVALGVVRCVDGRDSQHALAVLGRDRAAPGLAFFERREDFDALWSGVPSALTGLSVEAANDVRDRSPFTALGVEPFVVSCVEAMQPRAAAARDVVFASALLELVVHLHEGVLEPVECGPGQTVRVASREAPTAEDANR